MPGRTLILGKLLQKISFDVETNQLDKLITKTKLWSFGRILWHACGKSTLYHPAESSENTAICAKIRKYVPKILTWKSMRKIFFSWSFSFSSGQKKALILQHFWLYIIISIGKEIRPMLRLSNISFYLKS